MTNTCRSDIMFFADSIVMKPNNILLKRLDFIFFSIRRCQVIMTENIGRFPFNKNSGLKFRKFSVFNGTVHSGSTDPTQATARLVIVLASRIRKSGTGDNNFVKWKGTFRSDRPK